MYEIPIVLYTFRRLDTVKLIFEKIQEIKPAELYVFCDAARDGLEDEAKKVQSVRDFIDSAITWDCNFHREFAEANLGCTPNIIRGFDKVLSEHTYAIFLEDDAVPTLEFFEYMKQMLIKYNGDDRLQYVAGFNAIGDNDIIKTSYTFGAFAPMSGAIGVWADKWNTADFKASMWPQLSKDKSFRARFFTNEYYKKATKEFKDAYESGYGEWDIMLHFDMLSKNRLAIVPAINLVRSYGYEEGAFHKQEEKIAKRLIKVMDYSNKTFAFPMNEPSEVVCNKAYDKKRQDIFLSVNGNYFERHFRYVFLAVKDFAYNHAPKGLWNAVKKIVK